PPGAAPDLQREAARRAVERRLAIITGGPGTGKTSTVVRVLAALLDQAPELRVQLLAPTGKAAVRMSEAIREAKEDRERLDVSDAVRALIPEDASTIHRALGYQPGSPTRFFHGEDYPLLADVVVVDEASMVDLSLMTKLVLAVRPDARLVLLGDKDQLASVEAGYVLGELCRSVALSPSRVELVESHRFDGEGGIGALARAINGGDGDAAVAILRDARQAEVTLVEPAPGIGGLEAQLRELILPPLRARVRASRDPAGALAALGRFQVLAAHRRGRFGAATLNQVIERWLAAAGEIALHDVAYAGRPIVVTVNDRGLQLFNGDTGVILPDGEGMLRAYLPDTRDGGIRSLTPAQLPPHETFYATTVHKGQGSGYDEVVVILPSEPSPVVTRELLYTAVTRARRAVTLVGSEEVIRHAVASRIVRASGLADVLAGGDGARPSPDGTASVPG
ncbi:MAG: exodeoxyribonuclease V subunit alpha, partial [Deltaproteobacteria bacterium]